MADYSSFIDLNALSEEAKKELESFYEYLIYKYQKKKKRKTSKEKKIKEFLEFLDKHEYNLPKDYKFNRDELHERKGFD